MGVVLPFALTRVANGSLTVIVAIVKIKRVCINLCASVSVGL